MRQTDLQMMRELLSEAQSRSDAADEDAHSIGWVVAVIDPETGTVEMFGPWPKSGAVDAAAWAVDRVERFSIIGDDGTTLRTVVFPLYTPD